MDIWLHLQRNWLYFFWLIGETPGTLQVLVNRLEHIFQPQVPRGRRQCLNFRNQVSMISIMY